MKQLYEIAALSSRIADLTRFITSHPTANKTVEAEELYIQLEEQREVLRKELNETPDLSFS